MTIVESTRPVTGGVDTHLDVHVAAALDAIGGVAGCRVVPDDHRRAIGELLDWLAGFGERGRGRASRAPAPMAPGLARFLHARRASRSSRSIDRTGRSVAGRASPTRSTRSKPLGRRCRDGRAGSPRPPTATSRRSGRWWSPSARRASARIKMPQPDPPPRVLPPLTSCGTGSAAFPAPRSPHRVAALRPRPDGDLGHLCAPSSRCRPWAAACSPSMTSSDRLDALLDRARRPPPRRSSSSCYGVGHRHRRHLVGRRRRQPRRLRPKPRGRTSAASPRSQRPRARSTRHRLNRGGNRQANHALWRIVITRMSSDPRTRDLRRSAASTRASPSPRSCASSSATSPARSTGTYLATDDLERRAWPDNCPDAPAVLRNDLPARRSNHPADTAWPHKSPPSTPSGPSLVCQHRRNNPLTNIGASLRTSAARRPCPNSRWPRYVADTALRGQPTPYGAEGRPVNRSTVDESRHGRSHHVQPSRHSEAPGRSSRALEARPLRLTSPGRRGCVIPRGGVGAYQPRKCGWDCASTRRLTARITAPWYRTRGRVTYRRKCCVPLRQLSPPSHGRDTCRDGGHPSLQHDRHERCSWASHGARAVRPGPGMGSPAPAPRRRHCERHGVRAVIEPLENGHDRARSGLAARLRTRPRRSGRRGPRPRGPAARRPRRPPAPSPRGRT